MKPTVNPRVFQILMAVLGSSLAALAQLLPDPYRTLAGLLGAAILGKEGFPRTGDISFAQLQRMAESEDEANHS